MARSTGQPKLVTADGVIVPEQIVFDDRIINEGTIQRLIDENPDLIPIDDIGSSWGPLISLGREIATSAGPIDNLLVSPTGELTVVEAKLWRNPESRRKVVGQVLDYAAALKSLSYEELDSAVSESGADQSIWNLVQQSVAIDDAAEATFVDTVNRNLRAGRFLLLIVGDGIREDLEGLADLIGNHPDLGFHLELVEIRLYRLREDTLLVPSVIARTNEITRAIVEVRGDGQIQVSVETTDDTPEVSKRARPFRSLEAFLEVARDEMNVERAEAVVAFVREWEANGGVVKLNSRSVNLAAASRLTKGGRASLLTLYVDGTAELSVAPLSEWLSVVTEAAAAELATQYRFDRGPAGWPKRDLDLSDEIEADQIHELLLHLTDCVRVEEDRVERAGETNHPVDEATS